MYENKVVRVDLNNISTGVKSEERYQQVIKEYTENGWRFVQIFAPSTTSHGDEKFYDIIFERMTKQF